MARAHPFVHGRNRWSFLPAAVFAWFGVSWADLRILAVATLLAGGGYWHVRRRLERAEFAGDDEDDDELL